MRSTTRAATAATATGPTAALALAVAVVLSLAGCAGPSDEEASPRTTASVRDRPDDPAQAQEEQRAQDELGEAVDDRARGTVVEIAIADGTVTPRGGRVEVEAGRPVTLRVTSDADEEIHVHSDPEHTYRLRAGGTIEKTFTVETPGQVAVEAHHLDATIVQLVVRP
jgi:hypothetical protein